MADTVKWDFNTLSDDDQKAYIKDAKDRGFVIDKTTGNITDIPEMDKLEPITCNVISANPSKKEIVDGKPTTAILLGLDCETHYFDKETLTYKPTNMVRVNESFETKLVELGLGGIIKSKALTLDELKDLVLPKFNGLAVTVTTRMNSTDAYGYGSANIVKFNASAELNKAIMTEIKDMLELRALMANIAPSAKAIV